MRHLALCSTLLILSSLATAAGCKKTVEGESKRWQSANQKVDELSALYPGFKAPLAEQRTKAKAAMDAAEAVSDEKQRIKQMAAANDLLTGGFVGELAAVEDAQKRVQTKVIDIAGVATDEASRAMAQRAADEAKRLLAAAEASLQRTVSSAAEAALVVKKVTRDLATAEQHLDRVANAANDKAAAQQPAAGAAGAGNTGAAGADEPAAASWTCEYCDTVNKHDAETCSNCGAARPHAPEK